MNARVVWPPYPYQAGLCITDDTDAASFEQVRAVYDFLVSKGFRTTKTVWAFKPSEKCGIPPLPDSTLRGVTLEDERYLAYCLVLHGRGYEICLHGASAGNNPRERTHQAFDFLERNAPGSDTFICHAKNADNIYWEDKIVSLPVLGRLLRLYSKHACSGESESSPYFWGDLCRGKISQIRLLRTRCTNTLKRNPSMPYFDRRKPYVNGWFSATKRRLADCASRAALARLKRDYGLTVLYQYLHRYAKPDTLELDPQFQNSIDDITADAEVLVDTVSHMMQRLRLMQRLFVGYDRRRFWLINTNRQDVPQVQIALSDSLSHASCDGQVTLHDRRLVLPVVPAGAIVSVETSAPLRWCGRRCSRVPRDKHVEFPTPFGALFVNLSESPWRTGRDTVVEANTFVGPPELAANARTPLSVLTVTEEIRLTLGQIWIIAREILFKGRSVNVNTFLDDRQEIKLEDHNNW